MTMTMTSPLTNTPSTATPAANSSTRVDATHAAHSGSIAGYRLPRRFDVYEVERVTNEILAFGPSASLSIEGADVEMIDLSALAALDRLIDTNDDLRFVAPSVALRATMAFTGHDRLTDRCTTTNVLATAA